MTNAVISDYFSLLSKLMDIHQENGFKAKSYANAAFQIDKCSVALSEIPRDQIAFQQGIGDSSAKKIIELLETGQLVQLNELLAKTPEGILELMKIKGIGPKKIATIWHELGVESPGELLYACQENRLILYKGFGEKTQQSIQEALEFYASNQDRFLYAEMEVTANLLQTRLSSLLNRDVWITGAFVRQEEIIDQLEFVTVISANDLQQLLSAAEDFSLIDEKDNITHQVLQYRYQDSLQVFIHVCESNHLAELYFETSATSEFVTAFKETYSIASASSAMPLPDAGIFKTLQLPYIPAYVRDQAEIIPRIHSTLFSEVITDDDIQGVIHTHSTWSDGKYSIHDMATACIEKGYSYLVMSDHSVSSFYARGLSVERIHEQQAEIDELNQKLAPFRIFKSIECDILNEGQLDYSDEVLRNFDIVIASVHQNLKMTEEKAMSRLMRAIENPYTRILGHPTGRLLLSRKGYPIDYKAIIDACKQHNVVIEINANPRRLDIDWRWVRYAREKGVMVSINPDAHHINGIDDIRYGVLVAQKALLKKEENLSSLSLSDFEQFISN